MAAPSLETMSSRHLASQSAGAGGNPQAGLASGAARRHYTFADSQTSASSLMTCIHKMFPLVFALHSHPATTPPSAGPRSVRTISLFIARRRICVLLFLIGIPIVGSVD